jgi:5-methylcytosine-specific restriction endonuclease McrA
MRTCNDCKIEKPQDQFGVDKSRKDGISVRCKPCNVKRAAVWASKNKEKRKIITEKYRLANQEKCKEAVKRSQLKNPTRITKWVAENKEKISQYKKHWRQNNKEYFVADKHRRRGASGMFTAEQIKKLFELQKGKCVCCRKDITDGFHRDHITPITKGGSNDISNIQLLCANCNKSKSAKHPIDFMQSRGYLL